MPWDDDLEGPCLRIAAWPDPPLWVLAGPGTGKTFALMRRVARILEEGNPPDNVLVVTFTRTAAKDLVSQLRGLAVPGAGAVHAGTLHSLCFAILNSAQVLRVTGRPPRTLAEFEKEFLLVDLRDQGFGGRRERRRRLRAFEAAWARLQHERPGWPRHRVDRAFHSALLSWLTFHGAMLVGELVPLVLSYLRNNPACRERRQFTFLLIDEYQDLNRAEQILLDVLGERADICVVGDDDQSIYGFKYAHPEGITEYPRTHPGTHQETLTLCRRCPRLVVEMANTLIATNPRVQRTLDCAPRATRGEVWAVQWDSLANEAAGLGDALAHAVRNRQIPPQDIVVLTGRRLIGYRIRDELRGRNVPVRSFFNEEALDDEASKEKFVLLNLIAHPQDRVALRCWLGLRSTNGLPGAYRRVADYCRGNNLHPWEVLERIESGGLRMPGADRLVKRLALLRREIHGLAGLRGADFVAAWLPPDDEELAELRALALRVLRSTEDPQRIFDELRYLITQPELPESPDSVRVMSFHKSKGLTSRLVVLAGCMEGVIPHIDPDLTPGEQQRQLEEQRRLFYVAVTRTSETLIVSSPLFLDLHSASRVLALVRRRVGARVETIFTRFYDELGDHAPPVIGGVDFLTQFTGPAAIRRPR